MNYALRKIYTVENGYNKTISSTVGDIVEFEEGNHYDYVEALYQNPHGLFASRLNDGSLSLLDGDTYVVVSYDEADVVPYPWDFGILFVKKFKIEYACTVPDATFFSYFDFTQLVSHSAYLWGHVFKNYDQVIDYIVDDVDMKFWILYARESDRTRFLPLITSEDDLFELAINLTDDADIFPRLTRQDLIYGYAISKPINRDLCKPKITDPKWIEIWNEFFTDDQIIVNTPTPSNTPYPSSSPFGSGTPYPTTTPTETPIIQITPTPSE